MVDRETCQIVLHWLISSLLWWRNSKEMFSWLFFPCVNQTPPGSQAFNVQSVLEGNWASWSKHRKGKCAYTTHHKRSWLKQTIEELHYVVSVQHFVPLCFKFPINRAITLYVKIINCLDENIMWLKTSGKRVVYGIIKEFFCANQTQHSFVHTVKPTVEYSTISHQPKQNRRDGMNF